MLGGNSVNQDTTLKAPTLKQHEQQAQHTSGASHVLDRGITTNGDAKSIFARKQASPSPYNCTVM